MLRVVRLAHGFALICLLVFAAASNACRIAAGHRAQFLLATHGVQIGLSKPGISPSGSFGTF